MKKSILFFIAILNTFTIFGQEVISETAEIDAVLKTATIFKVPDGMKEKGKIYYYDFDSNTAIPTPFAEAAPSNWDFALTYKLITVSMGPLGKHEVPLPAAKINSEAGAGFYMVEKNFTEVNEADFSLLRDSNWQGYGHRDFKDNDKLNREAYKSKYPYFGYAWFEMLKMKKLVFQPYEGRTFVVKTTEGKSVKIKFTEVTGRYNKDKLFRISFNYQSFKVK